MTFKLREAALYYGRGKYPLDNLPASISEVEFGTLPDEIVRECCKIVAVRSGMFARHNSEAGADYYVKQVTHNVATKLMSFGFTEVDGQTKEVVIPASVQLLGNGFSFVWEAA